MTIVPCTLFIYAPVTPQGSHSVPKAKLVVIISGIGAKLYLFFFWIFSIDEGREKLYLMVTTRKKRIKKKLGKGLYKICTSGSFC
jgi:hypothetical protein